MKLNKLFFEEFREKAEQLTVEFLNIGLGYTAVQTSDGGLGLSYTYYERRQPLAGSKEFIDYEGQKALVLLKEIFSDDPLKRSLALALINALNYKLALTLPEDRDNNVLMDMLRIKGGSRVAMVGHIKPLEEKFTNMGIICEVIDHFKGMGDEDSFFTFLRGKADVLLVTSTTLLNNSTENVLKRLRNDTRCVMLGPGTPMIARPFAHLPLHLLAGTAPLDKEKVLKVIRHGMGTRMIHKYSKKVLLRIKND